MNPISAGRAATTVLITGLRGLLLAVLSQTAVLALFILAVLATAFVPLGVGLLLVPLVTKGVRGLADLQRRFAGEWSGIRIERPYRPVPAAVPGVWRGWQVFRSIMGDPATWRDLLWLLVEVPVGLVLGLLPMCLVVYGLEGILVFPVLQHYLSWHEYGLLWFVHGVPGVVAGVGQGVLILGVGLAAGPAILRGHAEVARSLLGPTRGAELALRVRHLTETRSGAVDAQAAELRRIERDLHDGPQARLVALSMNIGLAEELLQANPDAVRDLLAEARETSGEALAELRRLVHGIHPPVLAERGLDAAVRELALSVPLDVRVDADLPARLDEPLEAAAYFAMAELLANVLKHSGARHAAVRLGLRDGRLQLAVTDDGHGGADPAAGNGLRGVRRRLSAFDGTMTVVSPPGGPTVVTMEIPCASSSPKTSSSSATD